MQRTAVTMEAAVADITTPILEPIDPDSRTPFISGERYNPLATFCFRLNGACQAEIARYFGTFEFIIFLIPVG